MKKSRIIIVSLILLGSFAFTSCASKAAKEGEKKEACCEKKDTTASCCEKKDSTECDHKCEHHMDQDTTKTK